MENTRRNKILFVSLFFVLTLVFGFLIFIDNIFLRQFVFIPFTGVFGAIFIVSFLAVVIPKKEQEEV